MKLRDPAAQSVRIEIAPAADLRDPTAMRAIVNPLKMFKLVWKGLRTEVEFAPGIDVSQAGPPEEHHERFVGEEMAKLRRKKAA